MTSRLGRHAVRRRRRWSKQPSDRDVALWTRWKAIGDELHGEIDPHDFDTDHREVLGVDVGDSEDEAFWTQFLRSLRKRGLTGGQARDQ